MRHAAYRAKGRRWIPQSGGGGGVGDPESPEPEEQIITIGPGHGSEVVDIEDINNVTLDKFHTVVIQGIDISIIGSGGSGPVFGFRYSDDGGSTFWDAAADYTNARFDAAFSTFSADTYGLIKPGSTNKDWTAHFTALQAPMPKLFRSIDTHTGDTDPRNRAAWTIAEQGAVNVLRLVLFPNGGTQTIDAGTLHLAGFR